MDRFITGEYYRIQCPFCNEVYLSRSGSAPAVARLNHAIRAKARHQTLDDLNNRTWESVLIRQVIPFPKDRGSVA